MSLPPSVPTLSSPVGVPPNPAGPKSVRTRYRSVLTGQRGDQLGRGPAAVQQLAHVRLGAAQRLQGGDALQRLPAGDVEDDRIPRGGGHRLGILPQAAAAEVGPGVLGRVLDGPVHGRVVGQPHHPAPGRQPGPRSGRRPPAPPGPGPPAGCTGRGPAARRSTAGRPAAAADCPSSGRPGSGIPRAARAWPPSRAPSTAASGPRPAGSAPTPTRSG